MRAYLRRERVGKSDSIINITKLHLPSLGYKQAENEKIGKWTITQLDGNIRIVRREYAGESDSIINVPNRLRRRKVWKMNDH